MSAKFSNSELEAFLDEALPIERMAAIEEALRGSDDLQTRLTAINGRRDAGVHSLGEIWRRHRLSCPSRQQLGSQLLGALSDEESAYVTFHIDEVGCRFCRANLDDLKAQQAEAAQRAAADRTSSRRRK